MAPQANFYSLGKICCGPFKAVAGTTLRNKTFEFSRQNANSYSFTCNNEFCDLRGKFPWFFIGCSLRSRRSNRTVENFDST